MSLPTWQEVAVCGPEAGDSCYRLNLQSQFCCCLVAQSCGLSAVPWTEACQTTLSMGFPRQESWSGLPFPSPQSQFTQHMVGITIFHLRITHLSLLVSKWKMMLCLWRDRKYVQLKNMSYPLKQFICSCHLLNVFSVLFSFLSESGCKCPHLPSPNFSFAYRAECWYLCLLCPHWCASLPHPWCYISLGGCDIPAVSRALFCPYGAAIHYRNPCLRTCGFSETCSHGFCWLPGWGASSVQMAHLHLAHSSSSGHGPDQIELFSGYFTCESMLFCGRIRRGSCSQEGRKPRVAREWRVPGFSCL